MPEHATMDKIMKKMHMHVLIVQLSTSHNTYGGTTTHTQLKMSDSSSRPNPVALLIPTLQKRICTGLCAQVSGA
jgi:hypothetical protein